MGNKHLNDVVAKGMAARARFWTLEDVERWATANGGPDVLRAELTAGLRGKVDTDWVTLKCAGDWLTLHAEREIGQRAERSTVATERQARAAERAVMLSAIAVGISLVSLAVAVAALWKP